MNMKNALIVSTVALSLGACQQGHAPKQTMGTILGGALGGLAGSQVGGGKGKLAAVGAGVLLGGLLGQSVGKSLDDLDKMKIHKTNQRTFETLKDGQTSSWKNPNSGNHGMVSPTKTFKTASGYCREFTQTIYVGGKEQKGFGTACRKPDGTWEIKG